MRPNNQNQNKNRGRNRGPNNRRGGGNNHRSTYDSNGPNVRIRGSASQIYDKYTTLARDAASSGDPVLAESYLQYAEHYYRIANPEGEARPPRRHEQNNGAQDENAGNGAGSGEEQETRGRGRMNGRGRGREAQDREIEAEDIGEAEEEAVVETITPPSAAAADNSPDEEAEEAEQPVRRSRGRPPRVKTFEQGDLLSDEEKAEAAEEAAEDARPAQAAKKAPARRRRTPRAKAPQSPAELAAAVSGDE